MAKWEIIECALIQPNLTCSNQLFPIVLTEEFCDCALSIHHIFLSVESLKTYHLSITPVYKHILHFFYFQEREISQQEHEQALEGLQVGEVVDILK